jgi:hypothetical protein
MIGVIHQEQSPVSLLNLFGGCTLSYAKDELGLSSCHRVQECSLIELLVDLDGPLGEKLLAFDLSVGLDSQFCTSLVILVYLLQASVKRLQQ